MGNVALTFQLMPESVETDLEKIKEALKTEARETKEKPIAFGLVSLEVLIIVEDKEGVAEEVENKLASIEGVKEVNPLGATLI